MNRGCMKYSSFGRTLGAMTGKARGLRALVIVTVLAAVAIGLSSCSNSRPEVEASAPGSRSASRKSYAKT
jgi:hypothetical protein